MFKLIGDMNYSMECVPSMMKMSLKLAVNVLSEMKGDASREGCAVLLL